MNLVYAEQAVADLVRLRDFISEKNPSAAARVAHELISRIEYLRAFPDMGRTVAQAPQPQIVRDAVLGKYIVRYTAHAEAVVILRIWHHFEERGSSP